MDAATADLADLSAHGLREHIVSGAVSAVDLTRACLERIARREADVQAWTALDSDHALAQAEALDTRRRAGLPLGSLHGLPVDVVHPLGAAPYYSTLCGVPCVVPGQCDLVRHVRQYLG